MAELALETNPTFVVRDFRSPLSWCIAVDCALRCAADECLQAALKLRGNRIDARIVTEETKDTGALHADATTSRRSVGRNRCRDFLSHDDSDSLISFGRSANVKKFAKAWQARSEGPKKGLAKWAWGQSDGFMRRMMQFYPQDDEGVWGTLCAANDGTGPFHMVGSKR